MRANLGALILLFLVDFVTAALLVLVVTEPAAPAVLYLRVIFAILLVLVLPGYAVFKALLPGEFDAITQTVYSVGLSPCIALISGLLLHWTVGLYTNYWIMTLGGITLVASLVAFVRVVLNHPSGSETDDDVPSEMNWRQIVTFGMGIAIAAVAVNMAYTSAVAQDAQTHFTQLWTYEHEAAGTVQIGVFNSEGQPMTYRVLAFDDQNAPLGSWTPLVEPEDTWEITMSIPVAIDTDTINVVLYRTDRPSEVYRQTRLWLRQSLTGDTPMRR
jgi:uncharacterized membrane protein